MLTEKLSIHMTHMLKTSLLSLKTILENSIADEKTTKIQQKEKTSYSCHFLPKKSEKPPCASLFPITHPSARCKRFWRLINISALLQTKRQHNANI